MSRPFWDDPVAGGTWDVVLVAGQPLPGLQRVTGKSGRKLDSKSAPGEDGGTTHDQGYKLAPVEIHVRLWTQDQYDHWNTLLPVLDPRRNAANRAVLPVSHPALADLDITQVNVESVGVLEPTDVPQVWGTTIQCVEYRPPTNAGTKTPRPDPHLEQRNALDPGAGTEAAAGSKLGSKLVPLGAPSVTEADP